MKISVFIAVLCVVYSHTTARPSDVTTQFHNTTAFDGTPKNCSVQAWNEKFEKLEERLQNAVNGSDVPLSSNSGLHPHPVVRCQQESVVLVNDFGYGIHTKTNSTITTDSYRSTHSNHTGDVGSEDLAKQFESF